MAKIILVKINDDMREIGRILVDVTSDFSESFKLKKVIVKEPNGKVHFVKESLEEINQKIFEAELAERNSTINKEDLKKSIEIQEEMLGIMKWFTRKFN